MPVEIDIEHVARLARLDLTDEEKERLKAQLGLILEHAAKVGEVADRRRAADRLGDPARERAARRRARPSILDDRRARQRPRRRGATGSTCRASWRSE